LLFSAHSIPKIHTEKGDTYTQSIELSAKLIAEKLGLPYSVSYQSKIGKVQWSEPDTMDELFRLQQKGVEEIVLVPISFVNENLETVYDLDMSIIPFAQQIGINKISRVKLQTNHPLLIHTFLQLIEQ
jgi:ferrochelatase